MNEQYNKLKKGLQGIKSSVDKIVKENGITNKLTNYEDSLKKIYNDLKRLTLSHQDERFVSFNYYGTQSYIYLAKGWKYKATVSFLNALLNFIEYLKNIKNSQKWKNAVSYYSSLSKHIVNNNIELFGNTRRKQFDEIIEGIMNAVNCNKTFSNMNVKKEINKLIIEFVLSLIAKSGEFYTQEHLNRADNLVQILGFFESELCDFDKGNLMAANFILLKKKLHYNLRKLVPTRKSDNIEITENEIRNIIQNMKNVSNKELHFFKKVDDLPEKKFKIFMAELDRLSSTYYADLWVDCNFVKTLKDLERIFHLIRKNVDFINSPEIFEHFVLEFELLKNYFKIFLIKRDFLRLGQLSSARDWQKIMADTIAEELERISKKYFKYREPKSLERELLIVERATPGKFIEFISFYILREFVMNQVELEQFITGISNPKLKELFTIISKVTATDEIEWGYKDEGYTSDIDIFILRKYAIFFKSGILNNDDLKKIFNEIHFAKDLNLQKIYIVIDVARNPKVINKIKGENIIVVDLGEFLNELIKIAYNNKDINLKIKRSALLAYAGFFSGG